MKAISLRADYDGTALRRLAKKAKDATQVVGAGLNL